MGSILMKTDDAYLNNKIFAHNNPYYYLREALQNHGMTLDTVDLGNEETCDKILVFDLNDSNIQYVKDCISRGWQKKLILLLWEGPVVIFQNWNRELHNHFDKIFTWNDDWVDNKKYFKLYYAQNDQPYYGIELPFNQKKLMTMIISNKMYPNPAEIYSEKRGRTQITIRYRSPVTFSFRNGQPHNGNKSPYGRKSMTGGTSNRLYSNPNEIYSERRRAISFFEENIPDQFDLYGQGWDYSVRSYRGTVDAKEDVFAKYKFSLCYENTTNVRGYITEKIFDCMRGGCVPIYLGADNVTDYIPPDAFIDQRQFRNYSELLNFLRSMDEQRYNQYISNIIAFARGEKFKPFSNQSFVDGLLPHLI